MATWGRVFFLGPQVRGLGFGSNMPPHCYHTDLVKEAVRNCHPPDFVFHWAWVLLFEVRAKQNVF